MRMLLKVMIGIFTKSLEIHHIRCLLAIVALFDVVGTPLSHFLSICIDVLLSSECFKVFFLLYTISSLTLFSEVFVANS